MIQAASEVRSLLEALYAKDSKHAHYQTLPEPLARILDLQFTINEEWRGDRTRYWNIREWIPNGRGLRILDVGANTGFFSLSLADARPNASITACEPNPTHERIIRLLAEAGGYTNVKTTTKPACIEHLPEFAIQDVVLHLNILHHAGHDFDGGQVSSIDEFNGYAIKYLSLLRNLTTDLVFQMGYNWGGNKAYPLVQRDDQARKVSFTMELLERSGWMIDSIAFAHSGKVSEPIEFERFRTEYVPSEPAILQDWLTSRYGSRVWSEFYQRPIWFCHNSNGR